MWPFNCKHPAHLLHVAKDSTEVDSTKFPKEFTHITHHLYCLKCHKEVDITYAKPHWDIVDKNIKAKQQSLNGSEGE